MARLHGRTKRGGALRFARTENAVQNKENLTTIVSAHPSARIEVTVNSEGQGERTVALRRLTWGEGVGWYCQQTLCLDAKEAEQLLQALRQTRSAWCPRLESKSGKVIPFPAPLTNQEESGDGSSRNAGKKRSPSSLSLLPRREKRLGKRGKGKATTLRA